MFMFKNSFFITIFVLTALHTYSNIDSLDYENDAIFRHNTDLINTLDSLYFDDTIGFSPLNTMNDTVIATDIVRRTPAIAQLDSLVNDKFFNDQYFITDTGKLNVYQYAPDIVPQFTDSIYKARIAYLDGQTPFDLIYNTTVKNYINIYAVRKRGLTSKMLGLSKVYFPMFVEILDQYDLPLELKHLAIVESALYPKAGSKAGAKGLWQFMCRTGKAYDLQVTSYVDDRYDPYKSTIAACQHLQDLHDIYQDWSLALAAYNSGAGNVNKAIRRAGGVKNYWAIWPFLPRETRGYVPAFIAVNYVMNFAAEHNLYPLDPGILYNGIDTVHVNDVLSFDQISEYLNIPMEDVKFLNPSFKLGIIPANANDVYVLRLPRTYVGEFVSNQKDIHNFTTSKGIERQKLQAQIEQAKQRDILYVRSGETLGHIARNYHTSVSKLKSWNNLQNSTIYPGQKLIVYANPNRKSSKTASNSNIKRSGEQLYHTVKNGENLGLIAKKYRCTTTDLKQWNTLRSSTIYPKQKLVVYKPEENTTTTTETAQAKNGNVKAHH